MAINKSTAKKLKRAAARFWDRVQTRGAQECWPWRLSLDTHGYGRFKFGGTYYIAHRIALMLASGRQPPCTRVVMHSCDNPCCCNPAHLRVATQATNIADRVAKGRCKMPVRVKNPPTSDTLGTAEINVSS